MCSRSRRWGRRGGGGKGNSVMVKFVKMMEKLKTRSLSLHRELVAETAAHVRSLKIIISP